MTPLLQRPTPASAVPSSSSSALLHLSAVETYIGGSRILRGVDLEIAPGEVVALMGRNGVGKTTTLRSITGVLPIRSGTITLAGQRIDALPSDARARAGIGYVPQGRDIFPHLTVEENLHVGLVVHGRKGAAAKAALERVFSLFPVLKEMLARKGGVLSGGQQQQLAIGRALVLDPTVLILDEPTEGIQPNIVHEIGDIIMKLNRERGLTVLLVEQKLPFARRVADRFSIMEKGRIVAEGVMNTLDEDLVRRYLTV